MSYLVALDDGHGMETAGKRTPYVTELGRFVHENEFNKAVVNYMVVELKRCGIGSLLVAPTDSDTSLTTRTNLANAKGADIYVSVHYDALDGKFDGATEDPEGITVFYAENSVKGKKLATLVHKHLIGGTTQKSRGIKVKNLHVTRETNMPAILTENGFMDNKREALLMVKPSFQKEVAIEHVKGICEYFGVKYVPAPVAPKAPVASKPVPAKVTVVNPKVDKEEPKLFKPSADVFNRAVIRFLEEAVADKTLSSDSWVTEAKEGTLLESDLIGLKIEIDQRRQDAKDGK